MLVVMVADCTHYNRKLEAMLAFPASQTVRVWVCEQTCPMRILNLSAVAQKIRNIGELLLAIEVVATSSRF